jgi:hypothetical protein
VREVLSTGQGSIIQSSAYAPELINARNVAEEEGENYVIRDGIVIIPLNSIIPDGSII